MQQLKVKSQKPEKLTWKEVREMIERAGVEDGDEIDCIELSWGTADQVHIIRDDDFGWQIRLSC